jgi:hypothetical protein
MKLSKLVSSMLFVAGIVLGSVNVAVAAPAVSYSVSEAQAYLSGKTGDDLIFTINGLAGVGYTTDAIAAALVNLGYSYTAASTAMQSAGISAAAAGASLVAAGLSAPSTAGGPAGGPSGTGTSAFGSIASTGGGSGGGGGGTVSPTR